MRRWIGARLAWWAHPRGRVWTPVCYLLLAGVFYLPLLAGIATFEAGDFSEHFLPFTRFLQAELSAGRLPLWIPYTYSGHPFLADIQAAVYYLPAYPFAWLGSLTGQDAAQLYWLQLEAVVHTAFAGWGMHRLLFVLTGTRRAGAVAGVAFMLSGFVTGYAPLQLAILRSAVWLPWAMLLLWQALHAPNHPRRWLACVLFCALILLGGHAQTALLSAYALIGWFVVGMWAAHHRAVQQPARRMWLWRVGGFLATGAAAVGLAAAQLLPTWEFLRHTVRAGMDYAALSGGLPVQDTWQILLPGVFSQFSPLYTGVPALLLALLAVAAARWGRSGWRNSAPTATRSTLRPVPPTRLATAEPRRAAAYFFGIVGLLALLASYGGNGVLYPWLYRLAPGWDLFRGQERAAFLVALSLAALAGLAVAWLPAAGRTLRKRAALLLGGGVTVGVYAFGLLYQLVGRTAVGDYEFLWIAFYSLIFGLGLCLLLWVDGWSRARSAVVVAMIAANLVVANLGVNLDWVSPAQQVAWPAELAALDAVRAEHGAADAPLGRIYNEFRLPANYGMRIGVEDVWGASPLRLAAYARLFEEFPLDRMWSLTGVEYVLTWRRELFVPAELVGEFPRAEDSSYLHRLADPMPRVWAVEEVRAHTDDEAVGHLADHAVDLSEQAFLATDQVGAAVGGSHLWGAARVNSTSHVPGEVEIGVDADGPAFVVVSENWLPGWEVRDVVCGEVDACPAFSAEAGGISYLEPLRTNLTLIGIAVPPEVTSFRLVYRPAAVRLGGVISAGVLLGLLLLAAVGAVQRR